MSFRLLFSLASLLLVGAPLGAQSITLPQESPAASVSQTIGITEVRVSYHRPSVNQREVWGKLVPYGLNNLGFGPSTQAPWRAGANENTLFSCTDDIRVGGKPLAAGTYGLHMIVTESGVITVIFSRQTTAWGSFFYEPAQDALRVDVTWEDAPHQEQLAYRFDSVTRTSAVLALVWEKKRIPIPITVDTDPIVVANLKRELQSSKGFQYQAWVNAADFLLTRGLELPLALVWAETAISGPFIGERNFTSLSIKAKVLDKLGRASEASGVMDEALKVGSVTDLHQYGRQMIAAGNKQRALSVFKLNAERHPDVWPVNYGLARGYSANGDYPAALQALLKAQKQVPPGDTLNPPAIAANIEKLKQGKDIN